MKIKLALFILLFTLGILPSLALAACEVYQAIEALPIETPSGGIVSDGVNDAYTVYFSCGGKCDGSCLGSGTMVYVIPASATFSDADYTAALVKARRNPDKVCHCYKPNDGGSCSGTVTSQGKEEEPQPPSANSNNGEKKMPDPIDDTAGKRTVRQKL